MGTIQNLIDRVKSFNYEAAVAESLEETKEAIPELTRDRLITGKLTDGGRIIPLYSSPIYAINKERQNSLAGFLTPDLKLTGEFYASIQTKINTKTFVTFSDDSKAPKLETKYTPLIYGLSDEAKAKYAKIVQPILFAKIKTATVG